MPVYQYKHNEAPCAQGEIVEVLQSIRDEALKACPHCGGPVRRVISRVFVATPTSNTELKGMGFTKLVKRDDGVYENVTATHKESRYMHRDKPETMPDLKGKIAD